MINYLLTELSGCPLNVSVVLCLHFPSPGRWCFPRNAGIIECCVGEGPEMGSIGKDSRNVDREGWGP